MPAPHQGESGARVTWSYLISRVFKFYTVRQIPDQRAEEFARPPYPTLTISWVSLAKIHAKPTLVARADSDRQKHEKNPHLISPQEEVRR